MRRRETRGFTLVELLLAAALFSLVAMAAFLMYDRSARMEQKGRTRGEFLMIGQAALRGISRKLRTVVPGEGSKFQIQDRKAGDEDDDILEFVSICGTSSDSLWVRYEIERDSDPIKNRLVRRTRNPFQDDRDLQSETVTQGILGLEAKAGGASSWDSSREGFPTTVSVTLTLAVAEGESIVKDTVEIKVPCNLVRK